MDNVKINLRDNAHTLKSAVNKYAVYGLIISVCAILIATAVNCYTATGSISIEGIYTVQKTQPILWLLDSLPFVFLFWGQYMGSIMAYEASALIMDQTNELRSQTAALEQRVMYEATHDSLTELPNRVLLQDRLEQAINAATRHKDVIGLVILDLDRFKEVNDTLGHFAGDRLLKQVALRLTGVVHNKDTLARMGGRRVCHPVNQNYRQRGSAGLSQSHCQGSGSALYAGRYDPGYPGQHGGCSLSEARQGCGHYNSAG